MCLSGDEHKRHHMGDRADWLASDAHRAHLERIRPLAAAWHSSPEGLQWHRENGRRAWANAETFDAVCEQCDQPYRTRARQRHDKYCSNACKSAARRASGVDDEQRVCEQCGATFTVNKYEATRCCTKSCAARLRWSRRR